MAVVLGIDPALNSTGYALLEQKGSTVVLIECGMIKNKIETDFMQKLVNIFDSISQICTLYKPAICGIEETFVNMNATSSLKLSVARGAILTAVAKQGIPIREYSPNSIKKTITGFGKAEKSQVEFMVRKMVSNIKPDTKSDETDAIAIALACLFAPMVVR
jgi:crossover junction endodeoxyribonuclease RuvC